VAFRTLADNESLNTIQSASDAAAAAADTYTAQFLNRPDIVDNISSIQYAYPHLTPGATLPLAQAGYNGLSPITGTLATAAAARRASKGFGWHTIGDVVGGGLMSLGHALNWAAEPVSQFNKPFVRTAFAAANYGLNMLDVQAGQVARNIHDKGILAGGLQSAVSLAAPYTNLVNPSQVSSQLQQTQIGSAVQSELAGKGLGLGSGYFPGGPATVAANERRRTVYEIDGAAPTMGRLAARTVTQPGTTPYNLLSGALDFAKVIYADPANVALTATSAARASSKLLVPGTTAAERLAPQIAKAELSATPEQAGLLQALRNTVDDPTARAFATLHPQGRAFIAAATAETSPYRIWRQFGVDNLETAADIARTRTTAETMDAFDRHYLVGNIRDKPSAPTPLRATFARSQDEVRLLSTFPRDQVARPEYLTEVAEKVRAHMINARFGSDLIANHIDTLALADPVERPQIIRSMFDDMASHMAGQADADGNVPHFGPLKLGDKVYEANHANRGEIVNLTTRDIPVSAEGTPSGTTYAQPVATVRFHVSGQDTFETHPLDALSVHLDYTKARAILRPRNLSESEPFIRQIVDNNPTLGTLIDGTLVDHGPPHPFAELTGSDHLLLPNIREARAYFSKFGRFLNNPALRTSTDALDAFRNIWLPATLLRPAGSLRSLSTEQAFLAAAGQTSGLRHPFTYIATIIGRRANTTFTGDPFEEAARVRTAMSHAGRGYIDRNVIEASQKFYPDSPEYARKWADQLAAQSQNPLSQRLMGFFDSADTRTGDILADAKQWNWDHNIPALKTTVDEAHWPAYFTNRALADTQVDNLSTQLQHLTNADPVLSHVVGTGTINGEPAFSGPLLHDDLTSYTRDLHLSGQAPPYVIAERTMDAGKHSSLDRAVTKMFDGLWAYPMRKLTLNPTLKGFYYQRGTELVPLLTREAQEAFLLNAREAKLTRPELRAIASKMLQGSGELTLPEAEHVAMDHAITSSKHLLYDLHNRSQFGDIMRHFIPFYDAWAFSLTKGAELAYKHPEAVRRFQVTVQGARGAGFFHQDDQGNEVFSYPFPGGVTPASIGLSGRVAGLNLFTSQLLPGLGPVPQIAVSKLLPDTPDANDIRALLLPYGDQDSLSGALTPPWLSKVFTGLFGTPEGTRLFANTVKDTSRYLASTGKYDISTEAGQRHLEDNSVKLSRTVTIFRGLAQAILPSSPQVEWKAYDKDGTLLSRVKMAQMYADMEKRLGYDNAVAAFITTFGEQNLLAIQPNTVGTSPQSKAALAWSQTHRDLLAQYPDAAQYIAPQAGGPAGITGYNFALDAGLRKPLTYQEWIARANDRVGSMIYYNMKDQFGPKPTTAQTAYLTQLNSFLKSKFPGYDPGASDPNQSKRVIEQLYQLAESDPHVLSTTPAGRSILSYIVARDKVADQAATIHITGWQTAKRTDPLRTYLRGVGTRLAQENPDFAPLWDRVLSREVRSIPGAPASTSATRAVGSPSSSATSSAIKAVR
jgi:hypothetical protein